MIFLVLLGFFLFYMSYLFILLLIREENYVILFPFVLVVSAGLYFIWSGVF